MSLQRHAQASDLALTKGDPFCHASLAGVFVEHGIKVANDGGAVPDDGQDLGLERFGDDLVVADRSIVLERVED